MYGRSVHGTGVHPSVRRMPVECYVCTASCLCETHRRSIQGVALAPHALLAPMHVGQDSAAPSCMSCVGMSYGTALASLPAGR